MKIFLKSLLIVIFSTSVQGASEPRKDDELKSRVWRSLDKEIKLDRGLRQEYYEKFYEVATPEDSRELGAMKAALLPQEYPLLPLSHLWEKTEAGIRVLKHRDVTVESKFYTFGKAEEGKLAYVVQEHDGSKPWRTTYSYARTRLSTFREDRNQKPFKMQGRKFTAGHCIDHADTPEELLNFYGVSSTYHGVNLLPEPYGGWGETIRSRLVEDIRRSRGAYAQLAYYPPIDEYTDDVTVIPEGVLFFEHREKDFCIKEGWEVDWSDKALHYASSGEGPKTRLRENNLKNSEGKQIFCGSSRQPSYLSYFLEGNDAHFSSNLSFRIGERLDPFTRYRLQILADQEIHSQYYLPLVVLCDLSEGNLSQAHYWIKRLVTQADFLSDYDDELVPLREPILIPSILKDTYFTEILEEDLRERLKRLMSEEERLSFDASSVSGRYSEFEPIQPKDRRLAFRGLPAEEGLKSHRGLKTRMLLY